MESIKRIFLILILYSFSIVTLFGQDNNNFFLHVIEKGQSLYSIASMYGVSQEEIVKLNPGCNEKIYAGHALKIPQNNQVDAEDVFHVIQPGETLYRLSKNYNVVIRDITEENPGLSAENFKIGQIVRIPIDKQIVEIVEEEPEIQPTVLPRCQEMHKVKRKETLFSVSRKYEITEKELIDANPELKDGMKKGQLLCIPYPTPVTVVKTPQEPVYIPTNRELFMENTEAAHKLSPIKAAIILPFKLEGEAKKESAKMVEYYEGFLIAVDSLKRQGVSIDLHTYDSGNKQSSISSILAQPELKTMDIIFGPLYQEHIKPLSNFANDNHIRLVIPTTSRDNEVYQNPYIYQVNPPQSYLYSEVYEHFVRRFPNANVIILDMATNEKDKAEFIGGLRQEMNRQKIPVQTISGNINLETLSGALQSGKNNIFIPTSGNNVSLIKILPQLKLLVKEKPDYKVQLFGYPEWQTYTNDHLESFFELNTYFYSFFYTNNLLPAAIGFNKLYRKWYSKEMAPLFPKFGILGFDTAYFFLHGLATYGTGLENNISKMDINTIQTGLKFERANNWGGFINKKVYFINFTKDYELLKLDFD